MSLSPCSPVRLHVYFKLELSDAETWRPRWRDAARAAAAALPGLQITLSERPEARMTWMESYRGRSPEQMADGERLMAEALADLVALGSERHREAFVETFRTAA